jgi:hypothetical protein
MDSILLFVQYQGVIMVAVGANCLRNHSENSKTHIRNFERNRKSLRIKFTFSGKEYQSRKKEAGLFLSAFYSEMNYYLLYEEYSKRKERSSA